MEEDIRNTVKQDLTPILTYKAKSLSCWEHQIKMRAYVINDQETEITSTRQERGILLGPWALAVSWKEDSRTQRRPHLCDQWHNTCLSLRLNHSSIDQFSHVTVKDEVVPFSQRNTKFHSPVFTLLYRKSSSQQEVRKHTRKKKRKRRGHTTKRQSNQQSHTQILQRCWNCWKEIAIIITGILKSSMEITSKETWNFKRRFNKNV